MTKIWLAVLYVTKRRLSCALTATVVMCFACGRTEYARNYREASFGSIRIGMSEGQVKSILGQPLFQVPRPFREHWYYGDEPHAPILRTRPGVGYCWITISMDESYEGLVVAFDETGNVLATKGDPILRAKISDYRTTSSVLSALGPPVSKRITPRRMELHYSRSLNEGDYNLRAIELGCTGTVTRIWRERWYD